MSLEPNHLEERICLDVLADLVENVQVCYEVTERHVVLGVLSKNYETDEVAIDDMKKYQAATNNVSPVGLEAGDPNQNQMVARLSGALQPQHVNQVFTGVGASRALLRQDEIVINGLASPIGKVGYVNIAISPLSPGAPAAEVPIKAAIKLSKDTGGSSIKYFPMKSLARKEEYQAVAAAYAKYDFCLEPIGDADLENFEEAVQIAVNTDVKKIVPHVYSSIIDQETGDTRTEDVKTLLTMTKNTSNKQVAKMKIAAFDEVMLRFTPPEYLMLEQTEQLRMNSVGTGVGLLANLAHLQLEIALITKSSISRLGETSKAVLRKLRISDQWTGEKGDHVGSFFAEMGYGIRPTQVIYQNRHQSAFGISETKDYGSEAFLTEVNMVHTCGTSLSLTEETRDAALILAQKAHACQKKACLDFNYRLSLNTTNNTLFMRQQYKRTLPYYDIAFGSRRDLAELLGFIPREDSEGEAQETELIQRFMSRYNLEWFAGTTRSHSQNRNYLGGYSYIQSKYQQNEKRPLLSLDRTGAGDAYAAGILYGYSQNWSLEKAVTFATVSGVLARTI